jgi:hypothetical protein
MENKGKGILHSPMSAKLAQYEQLLCNELPLAVKQELVVQIEKEICPLEERIRNRLPEIVRIVQRRLFQTIQESQDPPSSPPHSQEPFSSEESGNSSGANEDHINIRLAMEIAAADGHVGRGRISRMIPLLHTSVLLASCLSLSLWNSSMTRPSKFRISAWIMEL